MAVEQARVRWPAGRRQGSGVGVQEKTEGSAPRRYEGHEGSWDILTNEMKRYEYQIMPAGGISYGAPSGFHDDCVIALALANDGRWQQESVGHFLPLRGDGRKRAVRLRRRERYLVG